MVLIENYDMAFGFNNIDYQEITPNGIDLHRLIQSDISKFRTETIDFTPPLPLLRFPFDEGLTFDYESGNSNYSYEVVISRVETISVPYGDYKDCFQTTRTTNEGVIDFSEVYCPGVGRVYLETNFDKLTKMILVNVSNSRLILKDIQVDGTD